MTSLQTDAKQSHGYFLVLATITNTYTAAADTGAGGSWAPGAMALSGVGLTAGQVLRDMGKTVLVGGLANAVGASSASSAGTTGVPTRVFRKVQLLNSPAGVVTDAANLANGVGGGATYQVLYIELPTLGRGGSYTSNALGGLYTYVSGLPGLYV